MKPRDIIKAGEKYGTRFQNWLSFVLQWECEFNKGGNIRTENVPGDAGGLTFAGIDKRSHPKFNYLDPSASEVAKIYFEQYWKPSRADLMAFPVGEVVANFAVNMGLSRAVSLLQTAINRIPEGGSCRVDGIIGAKTLEATFLEDPLVLADLIEDVASERYRGIVEARPSQRKFLSGWLNRNRALESWWKSLAEPIAK